jgi:hypothetical protein
LSIVVPVRRAVGTIGSTIAALLEQGRGLPVEIIAVVSGDDPSRAVIGQFDDPALRVVVVGGVLGVPQLRREGLWKAAGGATPKTWKGGNASGRPAPDVLHRQRGESPVRTLQKLPRALRHAGGVRDDDAWPAKRHLLVSPALAVKQPSRGLLSGRSATPHAAQHRGPFRHVDLRRRWCLNSAGSLGALTPPVPDGCPGCF